MILAYIAYIWLGLVYLYDTDYECTMIESLIIITLWPIFIIKNIFKI